MIIITVELVQEQKRKSPIQNPQIDWHSIYDKSGTPHRAVRKGESQGEMVPVISISTFKCKLTQHKNQSQYYRSLCER